MSITAAPPRRQIADALIIQSAAVKAGWSGIPTGVQEATRND
jgi:hypothetical protein